MPDYIKGVVEQVVDAETISVSVEFIGKSNREEYADYETIHIASLEPPFLKNVSAEDSVQRLREKLCGVRVYCYLRGRRIDGSYNAKVVCTGSSFRGKRKRV